MRSFDRIVQPGDDRVVFGVGAERRAAELLADGGARRVLLVAQGRHRDGADRVAAQLGDRCAGIFDRVTNQVPGDIADAAVAMARELDADWVVAHGGGSAIGVAKAIALELPVKVGAIPTTYAGSERTDIWGVTRDGVKTTGRDARVRPELVIYDPALSATLPQRMSLLSLLNALAHSVEALYAVEATDAARAAAADSVAPIVAALRALGADPSDMPGRSDAAYGAFLAGEALGGASMGLHHKLAHVLGGSYGTAHAATHATLLPHVIGFNIEASERLSAVLRDALGSDDGPGALADLMRGLGLSIALKDLELPRDALDGVVEQTLAKQYANPRPVEAPSLKAMLDDAWHGRRPSVHSGRLDLALAGPHGGLAAATAGAPLAEARAAIIAIHGRGADADGFVHRLQGLVEADGRTAGIAWLAPQAAAKSWYPRGFRAPLADNQPHLDGALAALDAVWRAARARLPADRIRLVGFSQGACLLASWLKSRAATPGGALLFTGAPSPVDGAWAGLDGVPIHIGQSADDPWVPAAAADAAIEGMRAAGARVAVHRRPGAAHTLHDFDTAALRRTWKELTAMTDRPNDDLTYQTGYGNALRSEARPGALPLHQNSPRQAPYGLFAEQINGTGFTVERAQNRRVWLYRLRPAVTDRPFEADPSPPPHYISDFADASMTPEVQRYAPIAVPTKGETDWLDGMQTFAGAGDARIKRGMAIHLFAADRDMDRVFCNIDGDLLLAPEQGRLHVRTELGRLNVAPGEMVVLPRGIRFSIALPDGSTRGFASELYDGHYLLPERGLVGANGLADERHFKAPVAEYEDKTEDTVIVVKQGGRFWRSVAPHSPFDVVAWHGTYAPFKYDIGDFNSLGAVSWDHPDPSILTVLTCPMDTHGRNAVDVAVFVPRWDASQHTFRPPYFHRNSAIEFNAVLRSDRTSGGYPQGAFSFTPYLTPHGVSHFGHAAGVDAKDDPKMTSKNDIWLQFESTYQLGVVPRWLEHPARDDGFLKNFRDYRLGELAGESD